MKRWIAVAALVLTGCSSPSEPAAEESKEEPSASPSSKVSACEMVQDIQTDDLGSLTQSEFNAWGEEVKTLADVAVLSDNEVVVDHGQTMLDIIGDGSEVQATELVLEVNFLKIACEDL